ncbi:MAG TPA: manganese efflux pump MntP family protein [Eubacteriales bacterium]|jgi:putative Mn2+ efflux pump MntP|nr:manganese efflux pump MntP family protein [Eubacteriales bacterium]
MMNVVELFAIAVGLSMDAFAAAVCNGLGMKKFVWSQALLCALFFGFFQALMPLLGYLLGSSFAEFIAPYDHWVAFALLAIIGGKMIWDAFHPDKNENPQKQRGALLSLLIMAVATSIDAFAVGVTFPTLLTIPLYVALLIIGCTTFVLSFFGVYIGKLFGTRYQKPSEIFGGCVLVLLAIRILIEGLLA